MANRDNRTPNERYHSPHTPSQYEMHMLRTQGRGKPQSAPYYSPGPTGGQSPAMGSGWLARTSGNLGTAAARGTGNTLPPSVYQSPEYKPRVNQSGRAENQNRYNTFMYGFDDAQRIHVMREQGVPGLKKKRKSSTRRKKR